MQQSNMARGREVSLTDRERRQQQSRDRMEDLNASTRQEVTLADLKRKR